MKSANFEFLRARREVLADLAGFQSATQTEAEDGAATHASELEKLKEQGHKFASLLQFNEETTRVIDLRIPVPPIERQRELARVTFHDRAATARMTTTSATEALFNLLVARAFSGTLESAP